MLKPKASFEIYTDGSVTKDVTQMGIAWVIATEDPSEPVVLGARLKPTNLETTILQTDQNLRQKRGRWAMRAEFLAVIASLSCLPVNSKIKIHTDHKEVARAISDIDAWRSGIWNKYLERHKLRYTLDLLEKAMSRHQQVTSEWVSDKDDDPVIRQNMTLAHNKACEASGSKNIKPEQPIETNQDRLEEEPPIQWPPQLG